MKIRRLLITALILLALTETLVAQRCSDISRVDFRNFKIKPKQTAENLFDFDLQFRNGIFDYSPLPQFGPDWRFKIVRDTVVRPAGGEKVRFIGIFANHFGGTGSQEYLIGFRCWNGKLQNVFQQNGEGMRVVSLGPREIHLRFGVWKQSDAHCCPSADKDVWFFWSGKSHSYAKKKILLRTRRQ
ncbi:MAG TPA: hypothetical protein VD837_01280 [Terriglobales bacterium]|nr:hypothetical protein [Terriglobales bacterium]